MIVSHYFFLGEQIVRKRKKRKTEWTKEV